MFAISTFGIQPRKTFRSVAKIGTFLRERKRFRSEMGEDFIWGKELPILDEAEAESGQPHAYFQQDLLVAKWVYEARPERHVDVGSRIDGFVGHLAVWREVDVIDVRPLTHRIPNVKFHQLDMMSPPGPDWIGCTDSLSCLHTIEHFGLGRYGDPVNAHGHLEGLANLKRLVKPGGMFYLSTPIGPQRVEFNAHRVFAAETLLGWFSDGWVVEKLAVINDHNHMRTGLAFDDPEAAEHFGCHLGVGIVAARKLP